MARVDWESAHMTRDEFVSRQKAMRRSTRRWQIGVVVVYAGVFLGPHLLLPAVEPHPRWFEAWLAVAGGHAFLFGIVLAFLMVWVINCQPRRFGVACPNCGRQFVRVSAEDVIATGQCPECGERILKDAPAPRRRRGPEGA